jgi:hypothetical protein
VTLPPHAGWHPLRFPSGACRNRKLAMTAAVSVRGCCRRIAACCLDRGTHCRPGDRRGGGRPAVRRKSGEAVGAGRPLVKFAAWTKKRADAGDGPGLVGWRAGCSRAMIGFSCVCLGESWGRHQGRRRTTTATRYAGEGRGRWDIIPRSGISQLTMPASSSVLPNKDR